MERGTFFYSADGRLLARPENEPVRSAERSEWRTAALALNPALDNPDIARLVPDFVQKLFLAPEDR
jgi:hypothetical protein